MLHLIFQVIRYFHCRPFRDLENGADVIGGILPDQSENRVKKSIALELLGGNIDGQTDVFL